MDDEKLKRMIRGVPDHPKPGILFYDITTVFKNPEGLKRIMDLLYKYYKNQKIDKIVGLESRGFLFTPLAYKLGCGFSIIRKEGKLPAETVKYSYETEYSTDTIELHVDAIEKGENVLIIDDLLATGGTANAAIELVKKLGGNVIGAGFFINLTFLPGEKVLKEKGIPIYWLVEFSSEKMD